MCKSDGETRPIENSFSLDICDTAKLRADVGLSNRAVCETLEAEFQPGMSIGT